TELVDKVLVLLAQHSVSNRFEIPLGGLVEYPASHREKLWESLELLDVHGIAYATSCPIALTWEFHHVKVAFLKSTDANLTWTCNSHSLLIKENKFSIFSTLWAKGYTTPLSYFEIHRLGTSRSQCKVHFSLGRPLAFFHQFLNPWLLSHHLCSCLHHISASKLASNALINQSLELSISDSCAAVVQMAILALMLWVSSSSVAIRPSVMVVNESKSDEVLRCTQCGNMYSSVLTCCLLCAAFLS
ncbi:hypothetical protein Tco_0888413, partial [Tanacetum coccineum]